MIDQLSQSPVISIRRAGDVLGLTPAATKAQIDRLVAAGILQEITGNKRNMLFVARGIIEMINSDTPSLPSGT
jgi:hypothetical protein